MIVIYKTDKPRTSKHLLRIFVIVNLVGKHLTKILTVVSTTKNDFPIHLRSLPKVSSRQSFNQEVTNIIKRLRAKFCKSASYFRFSELNIEIFKEILKCACTSSKGTWPARSHILMMPACDCQCLVCCCPFSVIINSLFLKTILTQKLTSSKIVYVVTLGKRSRRDSSKK